MNTLRPNPQGVFPIAPHGTPFDLALGNGTQHRVLLAMDSGGYLFVAVMGRGAYRFCTNAHPSYVMEKLGMKPYEGDAANLADFINDQYFWPGSTPRFGCYSPECCTIPESVVTQ